MRTREVQTRAPNQWGRTTTEASDQGLEHGLHVGFIDAGLQQLERDPIIYFTDIVDLSPGRFSVNSVFTVIAFETRGYMSNLNQF